MKLVVEELETVNLVQEIRLERTERFHIGAVIPYLYIHNSPAGTFTITLKRDATTIFAKSFTSADVKASLSTAHNYMHVFYPVIPDSPVQLESDIYSITLSSSGYSKTPSSYIGWVRQHEDLNNTLDYAPVSDLNNAFSIRLKILNRGVS